MKALLAAVLALFYCASLLAQAPFVGAATNEVHIISLTVDGKTTPLRAGKSVNLGASPGEVLFGFGVGTNSAPTPLRLRQRLEGYDNNWNVGDAWMCMAVRFYNATGDQISQTTFRVSGDSAGWNGSLKKSTLTHRRETVTVPAQASRVWAVISSAGPPDAVGVYVVANLTLSKTSTGSPPKVLIPSPFDHQSNDALNGPAPPGWVRDGNTPSMAKIIGFGQDPEQRAFAIVDDSLISHAEWHTAQAPIVAPGDRLVVEWNEMYSVGIGGLHQARYYDLPTGTYCFHIAGLDAMGMPMGAEDALTIIVPPFFWESSWFWGVALVVVCILLGGSWRYLTMQRVAREMSDLKNQQAVERERLRIAHDIHDDLGARVTQISLLSALSARDPEYSAKARDNFEQISQLSRALISALYQTVWAVNPENDNLDALGNYICQMVNQLCDRAPFRCRLDVPDLPREIQVSSQTRHNLSMVVKEAVNNVIKHANASEMKITMAYTGSLLSISVHDDGCGFQHGSTAAGNGLANMERRLVDIGGNLAIESSPGHGTTIRMSLTMGLRI